MRQAPCDRMGLEACSRPPGRLPEPADLRGTEVCGRAPLPGPGKLLLEACMLLLLLTAGLACTAAGACRSMSADVCEITSHSGHWDLNMCHLASAGGDGSGP